jgi:hypothetical protein
VKQDQDRRGSEQRCCRCGQPARLVFKCYDHANKQDIRAFQCEGEHVTWDDWAPSDQRNLPD